MIHGELEKVRQVVINDDIDPSGSKYVIFTMLLRIFLLREKKVLKI